ncbi:LytTR family DNA-binding domain-containing protein [Flavobacterium sp. NKUCC04_CG]|uniref:LytR/AlgR family response regulator transcription factor n=1 Tax=Flavobacterium sp. NKUCC04_CG TaxID=2842121 RepID=UPI001C5BBD19|nr:LytTR family DNA-binding domain-containing protein [Flavobacterium sp. NKUCC04_CG]MBW3519323.1 LytTR family DNA-binding domain-containing protein [Flavobacterium sp. NKUCC04_CG]
MATPYNCFIVDDEKPAHQVIQSHINQCDDLVVVGQAYGSSEALQKLQESKVDILFLDINMPLITGLELLRILPEKPITIITTAYSDFALESYQLDVVDYLLKPVSFTHFIKATQKAKIFCKQRVHLKQVKTHISVRENGMVVDLSLSSILFVESAGNYVKIFVSGRTRAYLIYGSLLSIKEDLVSEYFVQVHRSFIVNKKHIVKNEKNILYLEDNYQIPIGRKYQILMDLL